MRLFWLSLLLIIAAGREPVRAHEWYPWECCSGMDCAPIDGRTVRETPAGYVITVVPGGHPMWPKDKPEPLTVTVPYGQAKPSPDGQWHLCLNSAGQLLCFYAIIGGS